LQHQQLQLARMKEHPQHQQQHHQHQQRLLTDETGSGVDEALTTRGDFAEVARRQVLCSEDGNADRVNAPSDCGHASVPDAVRPWRLFLATAAIMSGVAAVQLAQRWAAGVAGKFERRDLLGIPLGNNKNTQSFLALPPRCHMQRALAEPKTWSTWQMPLYGTVM